MAFRFPVLAACLAGTAGCSGSPAISGVPAVAAPVEVDDVPQADMGEVSDTGAPTDTGVLSDTGCDTLVGAFADNDGDGFGEDGTERLGCVLWEGEAPVGGDCDDADAVVNPGAPDLLCGGFDRNCDGLAAALCVKDVTEFDLPLTNVHSLIVDVTGDGINDAVGLGQLGVWVAPGPFKAGVTVDVTMAVATFTTDESALVSAVPGEFNWMLDVTGDGASDLWLESGMREVTLIAGPVSGEMVPYLNWKDVASVATVDLDGDGAADVLATNTLVEQVYLIPGPLTPESIVDDAVLVIDDGITLYSNWGDESFGDLLAPMGDDDGDGVQDFVAMDASTEGLSYSAGSLKLRVFSGDQRGVITPEDAKVYWNKDFSSAAIPVRDLNGDGFDDLLFTHCADYSAIPSIYNTAACVGYGPIGETMADTQMTIWDTGVPLHGNTSPAALTPDLDGDGVDDLITLLGPTGGVEVLSTWVVPGRSSAGHFDVTEGAFWAFEEPDPATGPINFAAFGQAWVSTFDFGPDGHLLDYDGDGVGDPRLTGGGVMLSGIAIL